LHVAGAEATRRLDQARVHVPDATHGRNDHREDGAKKDHRDLAVDADAEPDDQQRHQHDAGGAVEEGHEGVDGVADALVPAHQQAERQGQQNGQHIAVDQLLAADPQVTPDSAGGEQPAQRGEDVGWARQEQLGHQAAPGDGLPDDQEDDD
jgi:hypothetical protein